MTGRKVLFIIWLAFCVSFILIKGIFLGWQEGPSDFYNYYTSAQLLLEGESITDFYDNDWFAEKAVEMDLHNHTRFAPFPPATAFLYLPLTLFSPLLAKQIWLVINLLLLALMIVQAKSLTRLTLLEVSLIFSLFVMPIASNLRLGQSYFLFTSILFFFIKQVQGNKKKLLAGTALGFAAALKYFPIVYGLYGFSSKKRGKLLQGITLGIITVICLPLFFNGVTPYIAFFQHFVNHMEGNLAGQGQFSFTFQSIDTLLANLFIYDAQYNPNALINAPILKTLLKLIFTAIVLMLSIKAYLKNPKPDAISVGICIIGAFLLIPATASYHLLLLVPCIALVISDINIENRLLKVMLLFCVFVFCNVFPNHIPYIENSHIANTITHFPRLYALMATFVLLLIIQKQRLKVNG